MTDPQQPNLVPLSPIDARRRRILEWIDYEIRSHRFLLAQHERAREASDPVIAETGRLMAHARRQLILTLQAERSAYE